MNFHVLYVWRCKGVKSIIILFFYNKFDTHIDEKCLNLQNKADEGCVNHISLFPVGEKNAALTHRN